MNSLNSGESKADWGICGGSFDLGKIGGFMFGYSRGNKEKIGRLKGIGKFNTSSKI